MLYELLAGRRPFDSPGLSQLLRQIAENPPLPFTEQFSTNLPANGQLMPFSRTPWTRRWKTLTLALLVLVELFMVCEEAKPTSMIFPSRNSPE